MPAACWPDSNLEHSFQSSGSTSPTFTFPTGYSTGNLLLVFAGITCWDSLPTSPTTPTGWTKIADHVGDAGSTGRDFFEYSRLVVFGKVLDGTEGGSITLTSGGTNFQAWATGLVWVDAKLDAAWLSGWADDYDGADNTTSVPALTATRTDNIYFYAGHAERASGLLTPTGFCNLEAGNDTSARNALNVSAKRVSTIGNTGSIAGGGQGVRSCVGLLIPANPYAWSPSRPVVGYIGSGFSVSTSNARATEDRNIRITEDGNTRIVE